MDIHGPFWDEIPWYAYLGQGTSEAPVMGKFLSQCWDMLAHDSHPLGKPRVKWLGGCRSMANPWSIVNPFCAVDWDTYYLANIPDGMPYGCMCKWGIDLINGKWQRTRIVRQWISGYNIFRRRVSAIRHFEHIKNLASVVDVPLPVNSLEGKS